MDSCFHFQASAIGFFTAVLVGLALAESVNNVCGRACILSKLAATMVGLIDVGALSDK